ncbi:hypothetical protein [Nonlabens sp.]|uniref:hypothetical protein n=1 Tax=Nonlabens sp. TaxID=1888209 RepID=UPI003F695AE4
MRKLVFAGLAGVFMLSSGFTTSDDQIKVEDDIFCLLTAEVHLYDEDGEITDTAVYSQITRTVDERACEIANTGFRRWVSLFQAIYG